jgi:hypothetical protein
MEAKEKADELIRKYYTWGINKEGQTLSWLESKQCALIAVDEILSIIDEEEQYRAYKYWQEVKREIENL